MWASTSRPLPKNWAVLRRRVLRSSDVCSICGQSGADEVDHILPRHKGGSDEPENLRAVHRRCHARKSSAEGHARKNELRKLRYRPTGRHPGAL